MTTSPVQFAKDFAKFKSDLAALPAEDLQLLRSVDFWPTLEEHRDDKTYRSYFDEYIPRLLHPVTEQNLHDLTLDELRQLLDTLKSLKVGRNPSGFDTRDKHQVGLTPSGFDSHNEQVPHSLLWEGINVSLLPEKIHLVTIALARKLFYVGCVEEGIKICAELVGDSGGISLHFSEHDALSEFGLLEYACRKADDKNPALSRILKDILDTWRAERETLSHERANCLFVEKGTYPVIASPADTGHGDLSHPERSRRATHHDVPDSPEESRSEPLRFRHDGTRGRLRILQGEVELRAKAATTDELTFENRIMSPDDPFIGVAYDSLEAVRRHFKADGFKDKAAAFYHAHFSIKDSTHTFTGDSIGLAVGLVTYTQLLKPEIMRQERFLASDVAFTGGLSEDGRITPVNNETLGVKIERAFFSPVKYLVLPESNLDAAKQYVEKMKQHFPRRRLRLIGAEHLSEVIENHNVVRAEKVCMGEFVARKAYKYSRMTKVQIPLLIALLYALICLIYPKAWIGFDWNPQYVKLTKTGFEALNVDSIAVWSKEYECDSLTSKSRWQIGDLDGDGKNEIAFAPMAPTNSPCQSTANLFVYNDDGKLLFRRSCVILGEYPGDNSLEQLYTPTDIDFVKFRDSTIIISRATRSHPARLHVKFWNASGDSLGWYINAGQTGASGESFSCEEESGLLFLGYNNRMGCACLFALDPFSSSGVSPPYTDDDYDLSNVKRGNQICYILFPPSDVNLQAQTPYNPPHNIRIESEGATIVACTDEIYDLSARLWYYLDSNYRVTNVKPNDYFIAKREALVAEEKLPAVDWDIYLDSLRNAVTYWTDTGWVTEGELRSAEKRQK